jgi:signal transduction histidine kinase
MNTRPPPKVLIVEDERVVARDLQGSLNDMGYDAFAIAASAEEALACAAAKCPDVVLMDIRIKGPSDGVQAADILRKRFPMSIIYLTAHADAATVDRAKRTEPHGYLIKPVKLAELGSMLEIVLHRRQLDQALQEAHERTRMLAERLAAVREEERREVAVLLHDGIAQDLFALKLDLELLKSFVAPQPGAEKIIDEINLAVIKCMESIRQMANDLRPVALAYCSVFTVIAEHAKHFEERSRLRINVIQTTPFPHLSEPIQLLLFRAAQEALTNVARHASATAVEIILRTDGEGVAMEITDDGVGVGEEATAKPRSLGLLALRERFCALGGDLILRRAKPMGTSMLVHLPVPEDERTHAA